MPQAKIEYGEYKQIVDILDRSNQDNVYQDLMNKEERTLDTINKVIKYYRDNDYRSKQFLHMNFMEMMIRFSEVWTEILNETTDHKMSLFTIFLHGDRPIYLGVLLVLVGLFTFFIIISD